MSRSVTNNSINSLRVRDATTDYAVRNYPDLIYGLITQQFNFVVSPTNDTKRMVFVSNNSTGYSISLSIDDYSICQSIAASFEPLPIFLSEPQQLITQRIKAVVQSRFSNRNPW